MTTSDHSIIVENLVKRYAKADKNAVDGVSFAVPKGSFFALLGPNGAGKTTTISILTTTLSKTGGEVTIAGYNVDSDPSAVRQRIGIIFQNPSLDKNLTAEENIRFHAVLYGLAPFRPTFGMMPQSYKKRVHELADILGISDVMAKPINTFSGGMKRKLEILRSLMHKPEILFLDEPTAGLDPVSRKGLWEYIRGINKDEGTTIFLTTHYLDEVEGADRICVINTGKVVVEGSIRKIKQDLIDEYAVLESPHSEELQQELREKQVPFSMSDSTLRVERSGEELADLVQHLKTKLSRIHTHTPTMEEAYIELISREQSGGAHA